jgi:hypothetical protein
MLPTHMAIALAPVPAVAAMVLEDVPATEGALPWRLD